MAATPCCSLPQRIEAPATLIHRHGSIGQRFAGSGASAAVLAAGASIRTLGSRCRAAQRQIAGRGVAPAARDAGQGCLNIPPATPITIGLAGVDNN